LVDFPGGTVLAIGFVILPTKYGTCEALGSALQRQALLEEEGGGDDADVEVRRRWGEC
jgi:hypothetical protein